MSCCVADQQKAEAEEKARREAEEKAAATKAAQQRVDNCTAPTPASTISDCDSAITEITAAIAQAEAAGGVGTSAAKQKLHSWEGELLIEATRVAAPLVIHTLAFVT